MPLVTSTEMFKKAYDGGYAIGAFNVNNMEIVQGITEACQEEHAPVILQVSKGARAYANHTYLVKLVEAAVECCPDIPIVLHLDHGPDFETCQSCIDGGFTSRPSWALWPASRTMSRSPLTRLPTPAPRRSRSSFPRPAATLWPSPSAPLTALISSSPSSAPAMKRAFWFPLPCVSTFWKRSPSACPASPSCSTALLPCLRSM